MNRMRENRTNRFTAALTAAAFAIGAALALWGLQDLARVRGYASAAAMVTAVETDTVRAVYTVGGQDYTAELAGLSPAPALGETVEVRYSPADPGQPVQTDTAAPKMRFGVGAALLVLSGGVWIALHPRKKDDDDD